jgi:type II secretory pathway component HofQ
VVGEVEEVPGREAEEGSDGVEAAPGAAEEEDPGGGAVSAAPAAGVASREAAVVGSGVEAPEEVAGALVLVEAGAVVNEGDSKTLDCTSYNNVVIVLKVSVNVERVALGR